MRKSKFSPQLKAKIIKEYDNGKSVIEWLDILCLMYLE